MRFLKLAALCLLVLAVVGSVLVFVLGQGWLGMRQDRGVIVDASRPAGNVASEATSQAREREALGVEETRQILFGDLHVHTTFSWDAFMVGLPMYQGEGAHPPADACNYARFCSGLDFWSINDHAEGLTPYHWNETKQAIRECNAAAGDPQSPDMVSFLGWEWTQIAATRADHYGHKNVVLRDVEEDRVPRRPISSRPDLFPPSSGAKPFGVAIRTAFIAAAPGDGGRQPYHDFALFQEDRDGLRLCEDGPGVRELPVDCQESATTPTRLFEKLDDWGFPYKVIPHGNTWGFYTPPGSTWDHQLAKSADPQRTEPLIEVFSGHGNIEEYRPWRSVEWDAEGRAFCPEASDIYLPECRRAGQIINARCLEAGESAAECEARAVVARQNYVDAGIPGHLTVPGAVTEDWLDAGQCRDCYMPAFRYRPGGSAQYALAISDFSEPTESAGGSPKRFRFGFIASSDNHTARPGTGYKEIHRLRTTDAGLSLMGPPPFLLRGEVAPESRALEPDAPKTPDFERSASYFGTAGLVAVHARGRDRQSIWDALEERQVYGTSGDRILLWFDWLGDPAEAGGVPSTRAMGAEIETAAAPRFRVRAAGAFIQLPGCPEPHVEAMGTEALERLCGGECYRPSEQRRRITRIEVVRIRPQATPGEPVDPLVEDPWLVHPCPEDEAGCSFEFSDPEYPTGARDSVYYVRAIQEPTLTINASGIRCEVDESGRCIASHPCYADDRTGSDDDCLTPAEERAWSSPIYLTWSE